MKTSEVTDKFIFDKEKQFRISTRGWLLIGIGTEV